MNRLGAFITTIILISMLSSPKAWATSGNDADTVQTTANVLTTRDTNNIFYLHKNIFSVHCSNLSCHGGSFEPRLSTPASSYYSLVYHPVTKNNKEEEYIYRVIPYDLNGSVLYERLTNCCFVNEGDQMPINSEEPLSKNYIEAIKNWILGGAKGIFGQVMTPPIQSNYQFTYDFHESGSYLSLDHISMRESNNLFEPFNLQSEGPVEIRIFAHDSLMLSNYDSYKVNFELASPENPQKFSIECEPIEIDGRPFLSGVVNPEDLPKNQLIRFEFYAANSTTGKEIHYPSNENSQLIKHWSFYLSP